MKKLSILVLFFGISCSKDYNSETHLRANFANNDVVKISKKIERKYDPIKEEMQIWFFESDSIALMYSYNFKVSGINNGGVFNVDLRVKYKRHSLYEYTTGKLTKENNKVNGILYTNKWGGFIEFKNYQL